MPFILECLPKLKVLKLEGNQLAHLPEDILRLTKLERLSLRKNNIKELPDNLGELLTLRDFDVSRNELESLPKSLGLITGLEKCDFSNNQLTHLPDELGLLTQLSTLFIQNNTLAYLPKDIGNLIKLKMLNLSDNDLSTLPKSFSLLIKDSKLLILSNNPLSSETIDWVNNHSTEDRVSRKSDTMTFVKKGIISLEADIKDLASYQTLCAEQNTNDQDLGGLAIIGLQEQLRSKLNDTTQDKFQDMYREFITEVNASFEAEIVASKKLEGTLEQDATTLKTVPDLNALSIRPSRSTDERQSTGRSVGVNTQVQRPSI